jgi:hypothetical protein
MSQIGIINSALIKIGESPLSTNDGSRRAVFAFSQYDPQRRVLLRSYPWNFARRRAVLATSLTPPLFGFSKAANLPNDCLQFRGLFDTDEPDQNITTSRYPFAIEGKRLLVNHDAPSIFYTADVTDTSLFDPTFSEALAWKLAMTVGYGLTAGPQMLELAAAGFREAIREARVANAMETQPEIIQASQWVDSHWGYRGRARPGPISGG